MVHENGGVLPIIEDKEGDRLGADLSNKECTRVGFWPQMTG